MDIENEESNVSASSLLLTDINDDSSVVDDISTTGWYRRGVLAMERGKPVIFITGASWNPKMMIEALSKYKYWEDYIVVVKPLENNIDVMRYFAALLKKKQEKASK